MVEVIAGVTCVVLTFYWITHRDPNVRKILEVFEKTGLKQIPMFSKKRGNVYLFRMPVGLTFEEVESRMNALKDAFPDKAIDMSYREALRIVIGEALPEKVEYREPKTKQKGWVFPLGIGLEGVIYHDFTKIPHMLICGITQYGKSTFMEMLICSIILRRPEMAQFAFIDLKGGITFGPYEKLLQSLGMASNVEESFELLDRIYSLVLKRQQYFRKKEIKNIRQAPYLKRIFIVIDEAASLSPNGKRGKDAEIYRQCENYLTEIARMGGGLGFHLIYATQYPHHKVLSTQIKQNCDAVISFRLRNTVADRVVFDETNKASKLPYIRGRALYQTDKEKEFQAYYMDEKMIEEILEKNRRDDSEPAEDEGNKAGEDIVVFR